MEHRSGSGIAEQRAYRTAPRGQADLVVEAYALHDNAVPSGASLLTEANVVLAALTGRHAYLDRAEAYLSRMRDAALANPFAYGHLWCAADALADGAPDVALVGARARSGRSSRCWPRRTRRRSRSRRSRPGAAAPVLAELADGKTSAGAAAAAYVCRNFTCTLPRKSAEALREELSRRGSSLQARTRRRDHGAERLTSRTAVRPDQRPARGDTAPALGQSVSPTRRRVISKVRTGGFPSIRRSPTSFQTPSFTTAV